MNQKGFATLEVILMVVVIGILATIAVPRFTDITAKANTAKVQADLAAIDTAIAMQQMESADSPTEDNVKPYLNDGWPSAPEGSVYIDGKVVPVPTGGYTIGDYTISGTGDTAKKTKKAKLGTYFASNFHK